MQCRACGTEIAEKAIVCFRCGAATLDVGRPPAPTARRSPGPPVGWVVAAFFGLLVGVSAAVVTFDGTWPRAVALGLGGLAGGLLWWFLRGVGRRRRVG